MARDNLARLFLILLAGFTNHSLAQDAKEVTCTGRIVNARRQPIVGAEVAAYEMVFDGAGNVKLRFIGQATTKADGAFVFETTSRSNGRSLGAVIVARAERLALGWADWDMDADAEFAIELGGPTRIEGTVTDEVGGAIANAEVRAILFKRSTSETMREWLPAIAPLEWLAVKSDGEGRFGFSNIPSGVDVDLLVSAAGRATIYTYQFGTGPRFTAGQTGIKVSLPAEARIAGRLVDKSTGKGVPEVTLAVVPDFSPAFFVRFLCVSNENGSFDIGGLQTGRYLIRNGIPRTYVDVESGKTTSDVMIECPAVLQGRVTGPDGRPLADVEVQIRGKETLGERAIAGANIKTDEDGHYHYLQIGWPYVVGFLWSEDIPGGTGQRSQYLRLHRLLKGSQTVDFQFQEFPEGTAGLGVQVTDQHGQAIGDFVVDTRNTVDWKDYSTDLYQYCYQHSPTTTDGTFELSNLPGGAYWVHCLPRGELKGYKFPERRQVTLEEGKTTNITCQVLKKTARYGRILFEDGTPAVADVPWSGAGEEISVSSAFGDNDSPVDKEGYFTAYLTDDEIERVKGGKVGMEISYPSHDEPHTRYAVGIFPGELLSRDKSAAGAVKIPKPIYKRKIDLVNAPSLVGRPLPELKDLKIELSGADVDDKIVLVCFFDMQQRPSRNCLRRLSTRAQELKAKDVVVVAIQASKVDEKALNEWAEKNNIPFPVGMVQGDSEETRFTWGVRSLPWLILTDPQRMVTAEGFGIEGLDEAMDKIASGNPIQAAPPEDVKKIRELFREMGKALRSSGFHIEYKMDKHPLNEEFFSGGNIENAVKSQDPDSPFLSQWIAGMRQSYSKDIILDVFKPCYFARQFSYDLGDQKRQDLKGEDISSFDGESNYYFIPKDEIGTIATDEVGRVPPRNPILTYADTANIMADSARYALVYSSPALHEKIEAPSDGSLWLFEFRDARETQGHHSHQLLLHIPSGRVLRDRVFSGRTQDDRSLQSQWLFGHFGTHDLAGVELPQTITENGFLAQGTGLDDKEVTFAEKTVYTIQSVGPAELRRKSDFSYPFVEGTKVWVKDEDYSYYAEPDGRPLPKAPSLVGGPLPELKDLKIELSAADAVKKMILVCFFDMNQRPSRNCLRQLSTRAQELKAKDIVLVAVQLSKVDEKALNELLKTYDVPFPVGMVQSDEEQIRFVWAVKSLPWLILTDKNHIVNSSGFSVTELDNRIQLAQK